MSDERAVAHSLQVQPVAVPLVLQGRDLVPAAAGFYAWWSRRGAVSGVPHIPHPLDDDLALLYIGISPARETSQQTIRSRVLGNHPNGNIGSSTFRFILAALLVDALELRPFPRGAKVALDATDNARLSAWQREQLLLTWCARERPWEIEGEVIARLGPPLNSAGNAAHGFYPRVRDARAALRRRAAERGLTRPS
jgi:hypothetical protein